MKEEPLLISIKIFDKNKTDETKSSDLFSFVIFLPEYKC
jgi:hypothetical protein